MKVENVSRVAVYDGAKLIDKANLTEIDSIVLKLEEELGPQIAIVTVGSLKGQTMSAFALELSEKLNLGRRDMYDGLIIAVASDEAQVRIDVGYGLQRIIKDEIAARIIRDKIVPKFKGGKFGDGLLLAIINIDSLVRTNQVLIGPGN